MNKYHGGESCAGFLFVQVDFRNGQFSFLSLDSRWFLLMFTFSCYTYSHDSSFFHAFLPYCVISHNGFPLSRPSLQLIVVSIFFLFPFHTSNSFFFFFAFKNYILNITRVCISPQKEFSYSPEEDSQQKNPNCSIQEARFTPSLWSCEWRRGSCEVMERTFQGNNRREKMENNKNEVWLFYLSLFFPSRESRWSWDSNLQCQNKRAPSILTTTSPFIA